MSGLLSAVWFIATLFVIYYYRALPGKQRGPLFAGFALGVGIFAPGIAIGPWVMNVLMVILTFADGVRTSIEQAAASAVINLLG